MKQETLEEAALLAYPIHLIWDEEERYDCSQELRETFIEGAKWQQYEQDEFAIAFAEWCIKKRIDFFDSTEIGETYTIDGNVSKYKMNELLEIYKQGL
jgi:hypothetical protein